MANNYSTERYNPKIPQCGRSQLSLKFNGKLLILSGGSREYYYPAVSGSPGRYDPIPKGDYWVEPDQMWHCDVLHQLVFWAHNTSCDSSGWGMYRLTIHPFSQTNTGGRGGFFLHGGNHAGSAGCINLGLRVGEFVRDLKSEMGENDHCYVPLTVT